MSYHSCCCTKQGPLLHHIPEFQSVTVSDKPWMDRIIRLEDSRSADWSFTNIFSWDDSFHQHIAPLGDRLLIRLMYHGLPFYGFPIGGGDLEPAVAALHADADAHGVPLKIRGITPEHIPQLESCFPDKFEFSPDTYAYDYVYELEKMASLVGKKLHAKRNHINRFLAENPDWQFEPITPENLEACIAMNREWLALNEGSSNFSSEVAALDRVFPNFTALGLEGGLLRAGGRIIAYTIGEPLNSDTYVIHFEKAFSTIQGAYAMINRTFARHIQEIHPHIRYINREDDMGMENLQRAKKSYYPAFMVEKYTGAWRES